jgi:hypothetical protein
MDLLLAGLTVLVLGDSHLATPGYLVTTLHDELAKRGAAVYSYGACGVAAGDWMHSKVSPCGGAVREAKGPVKVLSGAAAKTVPYDELYRKYRPQLVVVVMGDTMAAYDQPSLSRSWIWHQVSTLTRGIKASGASCVWVGPPWGSEGGKFGKTYGRVAEMSAYLADIVAPCAYIDSLKLSHKGEWGTIDGQHFTSAGYRAWGRALGAAIASPEILGTVRR